MQSRSERAQGVRSVLKLAGDQLVLGFMRGKAHRRDQTIRGQHVSDLDFSVEQVLFDALREMTPAASIQGDCFFHMGDTERWVVRAIDGRDNFYQQNPYFCISIAYTSSQQVTSAWVFDPLHQRLFEMDDGRVSMNGLPLTASTRHALNGACLDIDCVRPGAQEADWYRLRIATNQGVQFRQRGCCNLSLCDVAAGQSDGYFDPGLKVADFLAGQAIAQAAGATASNAHLRLPWNNPMPCLVAQRHLIDPLMAIWPDLEQAVPL